ncbi:GMC family oxidoreductase [Roseovarius sp. MMSF_3350]|uniref:GMC family oxidoreductase n=1 Tax=Roseovarius sp. MMSF_3350 TaxID=3046706 RepID=UPI00273F0631|nr:GMC family oxidoreductase N-terminal domain-containing protein [Roseovarius sp. MMSF_3350]
MRDASIAKNVHYDYVIVGAGSSGCALAERLSRDGTVRVALLEAGKSDKSFLIGMPSGVRLLYEGAGFNWKFQTTPQLELGSRQIYIPRGKVIGGSSSINSMIAIKGAHVDFEDWAKAASSIWGAENMFRVLRDIENASGLPTKHRGDRGLEGPIRLSRRLIGHELSEAYITSCEQAGLARNCDGFNGKSQLGAGFFDVNIADGQRHGASMFLREAAHRQNLVVVPNQIVRRIYLEQGTARGVVVQQGSDETLLRADNEVILCAGAIGSPQLLMLSGIGPSQHLYDTGVKVVVDAPEVGQNLRDHLDCSMRWSTKGVDTFTKYFRPYEGLVHSALSGARYLATGTGNAATQGIEAGAFWTDGQSGNAEFQSHLVLALKWPPHGKHPRNGFALRVCQLKPKSVGEIRLASSDPRDAPLIDPGFLTDPRDIDALADGVAFSTEIIQNGEMQRYLDQALDHEATSSNKRIVHNWIRKTAETVYHPVGTCRMGDDTNSVVDSSLRVRGVENLRVADAAIMPTIPRGNTNLICMAIGVIAAEIILSR